MTSVTEMKLETLNAEKLIVHRISATVKYQFVMPHTEVVTDVVLNTTHKHKISTGFADLDVFFNLAESSITAGVDIIKLLAGNPSELISRITVCKGLEFRLFCNRIIANVGLINNTIDIGINSYNEIQEIIGLMDKPPYNGETFKYENELYSITSYRDGNSITTIATSKPKNFSIIITGIPSIKQLKAELDKIFIRYAIMRNDGLFVDVDVPIMESQAQYYQLFYGDVKSEFLQLKTLSTNLAKLVGCSDLRKVVGRVTEIQPMKKAI